jgi:hypothetical protein
MPCLLVTYASVGMDNTLYLLGVKSKKGLQMHFVPENGTTRPLWN